MEIKSLFALCTVHLSDADPGSFSRHETSRLVIFRIMMFGGLWIPILKRHSPENDV